MLAGRDPWVGVTWYFHLKLFESSGKIIRVLGAAHLNLHRQVLSPYLPVQYFREFSPFQLYLGEYMLVSLGLHAKSHRLAHALPPPYTCSMCPMGSEGSPADRMSSHYPQKEASSSSSVSGWICSWLSWFQLWGVLSPKFQPSSRHGHGQGWKFEYSPSKGIWICLLGFKVILFNLLLPRLWVLMQHASRVTCVQHRQEKTEKDVVSLEILWVWGWDFQV